MTKEIKFRAWDKNNNYFLDWTQLSKLEGVEFTMGMFNTADWLAFQQYTGLKDKNGKEIYEGDILRWREFPEEIGVVEYQTDRYVLEQHKLKVYHLSGAFGFGNYEIIGNIYENPELLK